MHKSLEEYLLNNDIKFTKTEKKWFNSNAYFPLVTFEIHQENNNALIKHTLVFKESEFSKPNFINSSDNLTSRITVQSKIILKDSKIENFKIEHTNYFKKIFQKDVNYKVSTNDKILEKKLLENDSVQSFFKMFNDDPEFDPIITGKNESDNFKVEIKFMCRNFDENYIALFKK